MLTIIILLMVALVGAVLQRKRLIHPRIKSILFQYVYFVATPVVVVHSLLTHKLNSYAQYGSFIFINLSVYLAIFLCLYLYLKKRKFAYKIAGVIAYSSNTPNTVFLGFPLILALFHNGTFIYAVMIGTLVDAILNFSRLVLLERYKKSRFSTQASRRKKIFLLVRSLVNPFSISLIVGLSLIRFNAIPDSNIMNVLGVIGKSASFGALFVLGVSVGNLKIVKKDHEEIAVIVLLKLVLLPLAVLVASLAFGLSPSARNAGVFIAALPTAVFSLVVAANLKFDERLAASSILVTTVLSVISIPIWYILLQQIH